jgi:putative mRNA 3-end processing factor
MVRVEYQGEVWVISGDYKVQSDPTCLPMEAPPRCHVFISESTFGLPIYRWNAPHLVADQINNWWRVNQQMGRCSVLSAYAIGKSQRLLAGLDPSIGPIGLHPGISRYVPLYLAHGVKFPPWEEIDPENEQQVARFKKGGMIITSGSAGGSSWLAGFGDVAAGSASGWMAVRSSQRWQRLDAGFVLSDHADWPGLIDTIKATGAERVGIMHGYTSVLARYLNEIGLSSFVVAVAG